MRGGLRAALAVGAAALLAPPAKATEPPPGYRMENYRAPVPDSIPGGTVVDDAEARVLWRAGEALFVDVLPRPPRPANLRADTIWRPAPRASIPGAVWLPNVGYGALSEETERYFRRALAEAAGEDRRRPLVFFCLADCWMSWNAAKRAIEAYGYENVYWYPEGTDGWAAAGHALETIEPAP